MELFFGMVSFTLEGQTPGVFGVPAEFPPEKWSTLKIEILQYLHLGLPLEAEILLKYVLLTPQYFYLIFFFLYILQTRRDILQTGIKEFRL